MAETLDFAARGLVKADVELQPLSAINDVFTRLEHGDVAARVVLDFAAERHATDRRKDADEACEDTGND
jgi:propanol-preferring alcohol dehydrogenase